ncbi:peptide MFS transporter [Sphingobacterium alkalisoli]|uniref:Peptide MFS transporter n=1 Tax=Sphingobacterium alkalisoli TaxID=1874115 RepID=A0A4U0H2P2_9SPHI|nr:peptide MFS transporter [Sphingobacterium alkalisoli]TJY65917.1 peptide MFS transporter [Sphingobacterium alkalisoli]GGH17504.1 MFS transporter [Sphingobacterium alkalisoli]
MVEQQNDESLVKHLAKQGIDEKMVMGHPAGLFVLFFTEMWERFSYYGMRALLTLFLISTIADGGWEWTNERAMKLYGLYTGLVYLTPLLGGIIADKLTGYKKAITIGALIMTLGHASMALEGISANFFYLGLILMILGNGMFKPNISSMVGSLYPDTSTKKDAGYTIFYMGINAGAFLGMLLCGYIGEKIGWHYGFGLAGIFMFFGMLQFYFGEKIFGIIGESPKVVKDFNERKIANKEDEADVVLSANVVRDRLVVVAVLMIASIVFFLAFEQAGGSMSIFAKDYTQRVLEGNAATTFKWIDAILTIAPIVIVTWVLFSLAKKIYKQYPLTIIFTGVSFSIIWVLGFWKIYREFDSVETEVAASWFQILNSFFIIALASSFSKFWEKIWNPSGPVKFALGLILVGIGFAVLAYGASAIPPGAKTASVSMIWLIVAYFFHTTGELCLSPVGLSYVSKLSPKKFIGLLFGFWFCASAIANFIGGLLGSYIDKIAETYSMSYFFMIFAIIPAVTALLLIVFNPVLKKMMHGVN